jgi:hypothetical protein
MARTANKRCVALSTTGPSAPGTTTRCSRYEFVLCLLVLTNSRGQDQRQTLQSLASASRWFIHGCELPEPPHGAEERQRASGACQATGQI